MTLSQKPQTKKAVTKSAKLKRPIRLVHKIQMKMLRGKVAKSQLTTKRRTKLTELHAKSLLLLFRLE